MRKRLDRLRFFAVLCTLLVSLPGPGECQGLLLDVDAGGRTASCVSTTSTGDGGTASIGGRVALTVNPKSSLSTDVDSVILDTCGQTLSVTFRADRKCHHPVLLLRVSGAALAFNSSWSYLSAGSSDAGNPTELQPLVASASFRVFDEGRYFFEVYVEYCERVDPNNFINRCAVVDYENLISPTLSQRVTGAKSSSGGIIIAPSSTTTTSAIQKPGRWINSDPADMTVGLSMRYQTLGCFNAVGHNGGSKPNRWFRTKPISRNATKQCDEAADLSRFKPYVWQEDRSTFPDWTSLLESARQKTATSKIHLCTVGSSHTRKITDGINSKLADSREGGQEHGKKVCATARTGDECYTNHQTAGLSVSHVRIDLPSEWTSDFQKKIETIGCSVVIMEGFVQWAAGWPNNTPRYGKWNVAGYRAKMHRLLALINASPELSHVPILVRTSDYNPHGGKHLQCPPVDWRTVHIINLFNQALREEVANASFSRAAQSVPAPPSMGIMEVGSVVGPLFDSAYDWNHYDGPVFDVVGERLLSIVLQHILHHGQEQPAAVPSPPQPAPSLLSNALPVQQQSYAPPQQQAGGVVAAPPMQEERRPGCPGMNASLKSSTSFFSAAQLTALETLSSKLRAGNSDIRVLAIGGSMMAGVGTHSWFGDSNVEKASSYSASFVRSLKEKYPGNRISYSNHATGGTTTAGSLPQLPLLVDGAGTEMEPDLILIDYSTNDRFERQDWTDNRRNWKFSVADNFGPVFAATEALLRFLLRAHPRTAVAIVDTFLEPDTALATSSQAHFNASLTYGVAYIQPRDFGAEAPAGALHPPLKVHDSLAVGVANWWSWISELVVRCERSALTGAVPPFPEKPMSALASKYRVCEAALSTYDAAQAVSENGRSLLPKSVQTGQKVGIGFNNMSWKNRTDKAAWIANREGTSLEFALSFGASPRIAVVFMKGYNKADFGNLQVWMTHRPKWDRYYMKGCCNKDKVTQSHVEVINVAQSHNQQNLETGVHGFAVKPFSKGVLRLTFRKDQTKANATHNATNPYPDQHFAIMHVSSC